MQVVRVFLRRLPRRFFQFSQFSALLALSLIPAAYAGGDYFYPPAQGKSWVGTWATAGSTTGLFDAPVVAPNDQTLRQIVRISTGGKRLRVRLSNVQGNAPLTIGAATVAHQVAGSAIDPGTMRTLTFGGETSITIAAGARVFSDPVRLRVGDLADLAISLYLPDGATDAASPVTNHVRALQTAYVSSGDTTGETDPLIDSSMTSYFYLTGVDVRVAGHVPVIAFLGDSITNGDTSTTDANKRYPNLLAERILSRNAHPYRPRRVTRAGLLNLGISGNQVTNTLIGGNAQARLDRDVLTQTGVTHLVLLAGINDIGLPSFLNAIGIPFPLVSADAIIAGYKQIIARAKARGLRVIGATVTPAGGFVLPGSDYATAEGEAKRQAVNDWIRTSGAFDAVIDFDAVLRDPADPTVLRADLTDDGLHPNDAGYQVMASETPLRFFR